MQKKKKVGIPEHTYIITWEYETRLSKNEYNYANVPST